MGNDVSEFESLKLIFVNYNILPAVLRRKKKEEEFFLLLVKFSFH